MGCERVYPRKIELEHAQWSFDFLVNWGALWSFPFFVSFAVGTVF
jgi:hypothetical protein